MSQQGLVQRRSATGYKENGFRPHFRLNWQSSNIVVVRLYVVLEHVRAR